MKTIIFDFNGTLLDDRDVCLDIFNILLKEYNLGSCDMKKYLDIFRFPVIEYYLEVGFSKDDFSKIGNEFHDYYNKLSPTKAKVFDSAYEILKYLKTKNYRLICLSASMQSTLINQLKYYKIYDYFDAIIGLDNNKAFSKVDVAIECMKKNNINHNDCLFIGDSLHDKEVADAINVDCYLISTGHTARYRLEKVCKNIIDDLLELKKVL